MTVRAAVRTARQLHVPIKNNRRLKWRNVTRAPTPCREGLRRSESGLLPKRVQAAILLPHRARGAFS
eukprot:CAMPEP_0115339930 /NCGR_PEP_ID=MMETSP0270-20121206/90880_1 /TAXON_ID=71861 /ORGANISM="Scrippsiella trochoidea, Strain CCMP3099" /LENGTH=66 /DNA_ID=CAMNT_0002761359 /DNA_START=90 /DNA_END=287 /DNA_ORIENTATION=-